MEKAVYIAGAHSRARTLRAYLAYLCPAMEVEAYLVDNMSENEKEVEGIPVWLIGEGLHIENTVFIGTRGVNHPKIEGELRAAGFTRIIPVTVELDRKLRNDYVRKLYQSQGREFVMIGDLDVGGQAHDADSKNICGGFGV